MRGQEPAVLVIGHPVAEPIRVDVSDTNYKAIVVIDSTLAKRDQMALVMALSVLLADSRRVEVPAGFVTDCHSTPAFLASVLPEYDNRTNLAAIVHDFLYMEWESHTSLYPELVELKLAESRAYADSIYLELMERFNPGSFRNRIYYAGVRLFGGWNWRKFRAHTKALPNNLRPGHPEKAGLARRAEPISTGPGR